MSSNRKEFNRQETVRHIQATFISLYAKNGIGGITVEKLCKACKISKSTFYFYFSDKYSVLDSIEQELLDHLGEINKEYDVSMADVAAGVPSATLIETVDYIREKADVFRALVGRNGDSAFVFKWRSIIERDFLNRYVSEKGNDRIAPVACTIFSSCVLGLDTHFLFRAPEMTTRNLCLIVGNITKFALFDFNAFAD